ncbi:hypothetical protein F5876DRAFT_66940 [Lentinula aff. lateritia]|uniref:Uncharacterized protein n=1 Tax=Lentinula aff. lateritia TaxID=2804960 RepID=A0ACC1TW93_9AGAR|nr:hypothetical protein F5876DRAFT_66940 [Lentinula aff. lateritia]
MPPEYYAVSIEFGDPNSTTFVVLPSLHFSARSIQSAYSGPGNRTLAGHGSGAENKARLSGTSIANLLETMAPIRVVQADTEGNVFYKAEIETQTIPDTVMDRLIGSSSNSLNDLSSNAATHQRQDDLTRSTNMPENIVAQVIAPLAMEEPEVKTEPESISSAIRCQGIDVKHFVEAHTQFDLKRKVINKNTTTSWYTYRTPGPLDSPPEFPPNSMRLEHNVIFLHINEAERAKLNEGQLSKLLKYCVRMWIWNGDSLRWERIYFGERRVVGDGYELAIALRYRKVTYFRAPLEMQFIEDVNHDIHVAQDAWNEAVEHWQQSIIGLETSTEEKHKSLSRLATETNKLINHLNLFTEDYGLTVTSLLQGQTSVHSSSSARNIAQNPKAIRTLVIHSSRLQEELLEDLPLRRALIRKLETVYTKAISAPKGNFLKEDLLQAFLLAGRCRDVLKAVDSSFKRSGIVGDHHTLDDMQSMFTNIKRRSLAMVFDIIEQFREDEHRIITKIKGTNDILQAHQESHQEKLDVLKDCTENMIERLDLKLNGFKEKPNKSSAHGNLQYGQGNTTEYIGDLWTIALRFLPIHGTEDVGKIQRSVADELRRLVAERFAVENLRIHSSFMTSIYNSATQSGDSKLNRSSENISTLLDQDLEMIAETPKCVSEVEIHCSIPDSEGSNYSPSNSLAGELAHLDLVHATICDLELEAKTTLSQSECDDAAERDLQDRRSHFFTRSSDTGYSWVSFNSYLLSVLFALATSDPVQSCSSALVSLKLRARWPMPTLPVFKYNWDELQLSSIAIIRISGAVRFWIASKLNTSLGRNSQFFGGIVYSHRKSFPHPKPSKALKATVDRKILEVSHNYLPFDFRRILILYAIYNRLALTTLSAFNITPPHHFDPSKCVMRSEWREVEHITYPNARTRILGVVLSGDARYLAVAQETCVDIWNVKVNMNPEPLVQYSSKENRISFIAWSQRSPQLVISYEGGLVYVITMKERSSSIEGFHHSGQTQQTRTFSVFLHKDLLVVAMGKVVEIRGHRDRNDSSNSPHWELLKTLPAPPIDKYLPIGAIQSIHAMSRDRILISYENGVAVDESLWSIVHSDSLDFEHEDMMLIPGVINDVCPGKGTVLVTVAGTYQIFVLGSETAQNIFVPCDPLSKTPQTVSCTKFISEDLVIGAGVGQLVLWNAELGNRYLSPLWYQCRRSKLYLSAYKSEEDSGWIVTVHEIPDRHSYEIVFWTTADLQEDATEPESHDDSQCTTC